MRACVAQEVAGLTAKPFLDQAEAVRQKIHRARGRVLRVGAERIPDAAQAGQVVLLVVKIVAVMLVPAPSQPMGTLFTAAASSPST